MRAIFMIPTKPPPSFRNPDEWSPEFVDFVTKCLVKNPENRASASELINHEFIKKKAKSKDFIVKMIHEANLAGAAEDEKENDKNNNNGAIKDGANNNSSTMKPSTSTTSEREHHQNDSGSKTAPLLKSSNSNTKIADRPNRNENQTNNPTMISDVESDLGTLIINNETDDEDSEKTLRPSFMQHFDKKRKNLSNNNSNKTADSDLNFGNTMEVSNDEDSSMKQINVNEQSNQFSTFNQTDSDQYQNQPQQNAPNAVRSLLLDGDFEFLRNMTLEQLKNKRSTLDQDMENEIEELNQRYAAKRQPIIDAIEQKQKRQLNF